MNANIQKRWVAKLRSGKIKQIRHQLNNGNGMCCLGVLCDLAADDGVVTRREDWHGSVQYLDNGVANWAFLSTGVLRWSGLRRTDGGDVVIAGKKDSLLHHNEDGRTFAQIADAIEKQL